MIYTIEESTAKSLADQVRRLTGTTDEMGTDEMAVKLKSVEVGGGSGEDLTGLIDGTLTEISDNNVKNIRHHAFAYAEHLTNINFPACTSISGYAFDCCTGLTSATFPACTYIGNCAFSRCSNLYSIDFPVCNSKDHSPAAAASD